MEGLNEPIVHRLISTALHGMTGTTLLRGVLATVPRASVTMMGMIAGV